MKRSNKYALMSAALLAGAVSFSSCSNDEEVSAPYGTEGTETALAVQLQGIGKKAGRGVASDVNKDEQGKSAFLNNIGGVVLRPYSLNKPGQDITLAGITTTEAILGTDGTLTKKYQATIPLNTDAIYFYGLPAGVTALPASFALVAYGTDDDKPTASETGKTYSKVAPLYFYGEDKALKMSAEDYDNVTWANVPAGGQINGTIKSVQVDQIGYAVGVLEQTAKLALTDNSFLPENVDVANVKVDVVNGELAVTADNVPVTLEGMPEDANMTVLGYVIEGQTGDVNNDFSPKTVDATVYDGKWDATTPANTMIDNGAATTTSYTSLFETETLTAAKKVIVKLRCKNTSGRPFVSLHGASLGTGGYAPGIIPVNGEFYLVATINVDPTTAGANEDYKKRFITRAYTTNANYTVTSLKNAYGEKDPEIIDAAATVGVIVDLTWTEGLVFDVTID
jgi:hypothetical protein